MKQYKILQICVDLDGGGIDRFLYNYCSRIPNIQFDFAIIKKDSVGILEKSIEDLGCRIYKVPRLREGLWKNYKAIKKILEQNSYDAVHVHLGAEGSVSLLCAKMNGIKTRIVHSHAAFVPESKKQRYARYVMTCLSKLLCTDLAACGNDAAMWLWGKKAYEAGKIHVQNNAIDTNTYAFNQEARQHYRNLFGITDNTLVVGHVGRISDQKNQKRIIDIFAKIREKCNDTKLILIGREDEGYTINDKISEHHLEENVICLGVRDDVPELLNMFDIFLFPSKFEGLPFTLIETQCNGLQNLCSSVISSKVAISDCIEFLSLDDSDEVWAQKCLQIASKGRDKNARNDVAEAGYDLDVEAQRLYDYYTKLIANHYDRI